VQRGRQSIETLRDRPAGRSDDDCGLVHGNYRLDKARCRIEVLQLGSFIDLVRGTRKIAEDADDDIVSAEPIRHLRERRLLDLKCERLTLARGYPVSPDKGPRHRP